MFTCFLGGEGAPVRPDYHSDSFLSDNFLFDSYQSEEPGGSGRRPGYQSAEPRGGGRRPGYQSEEPGRGGRRPGYQSEELRGGGRMPGYQSEDFLFDGYQSEEPGGGGRRPGYQSEEPGRGGRRPGYQSEEREVESYKGASAPLRQVLLWSCYSSWVCEMSDEVVNFPYYNTILDIYTAVPVKNFQVYPRSILSKILGNTCCKSKKPVVKKLQRKDVLITSAERRQEIKQRERDEKA